ncbi:MAG: hypothetical protein ABI537_03865 [Casimicrobiaceae bacterium]
MSVRWPNADQIATLRQAIAIAWPVSVLEFGGHTPQPTPPVDDDDDDEDRRGGGSGGGNIDPDHDDSGPDEDDDEDDDEGDTLWTGCDTRPPAIRP